MDADNMRLEEFIERLAENPGWSDLRDLKRLASAESKAKLYCLADFDPKKEIYQIVDPYYDSTGQLFDQVGNFFIRKEFSLQIFPEITRCLEAFLDSLEE